MPAAALSTKVVVTGTVVGVDLMNHTISLVNPSGGMVHTFDVTDPHRQAALKRVKVGDSLTAIGTEAFANALEPFAPWDGRRRLTYDQITVLRRSPLRP